MARGWQEMYRTRIHLGYPNTCSTILIHVTSSCHQVKMALLTTHLGLVPHVSKRKNSSHFPNDSYMHQNHSICLIASRKKYQFIEADWRIYISKSTILVSYNGLPPGQPSHYLNQCWNTVNWTPRNKLQWNFDWNSYIVWGQGELTHCRLVMPMALQALNITSLASNSWDIADDKLNS